MDHAAIAALVCRNHCKGQNFPEQRAASIACAGFEGGEKLLVYGGGDGGTKRALCATGEYAPINRYSFN